MFKYEVSNIEMRVMTLLWENEKAGLTVEELKESFEKRYEKKHYISEFERILSDLVEKEYVEIKDSKYFCKYNKEDFLHNLSRMFVRRYFDSSVYDFLASYAGEINLDNEEIVKFKQFSEYSKRKREQGVQTAKSKGVKFGSPLRYSIDEYFPMYKRYREGNILLQQLIDAIGCARSTYYYRLQDEFKKKYEEKYGTT